MADEKRYTFLELDEKAKERVMNRRADWLLDDDWHEFVIDDWIGHVRDTVGIEIDRETINFEVGSPGSYATFSYFFSTNNKDDMDVLRILLDEALRDTDVSHECLKTLVLKDIYCGVDVCPVFRVSMGAHWMLSSAYDDYSRVSEKVSQFEGIFIDFLCDYFRKLADELADALEDRYDSILTDEEYASEIFEANDIYFDVDGNEIDY